MLLLKKMMKFVVVVVWNFVLERKREEPRWKAQLKRCRVDMKMQREIAVDDDDQTCCD